MYLLPGFSSRSGHISKPLLSWVHLFLNPTLGSNLYLLLCNFALPQWREVGWMGQAQCLSPLPKEGIRQMKARQALILPSQGSP